MPGVWKKTLNYLGLVEDEELEEQEYAQAQAAQADAVPELPSHPATTRRFGRSQPVAVEAVAEPAEAVIRTIPQPRVMPATTIHRSEPKMFNEARDLGERFRDGIPVIMNLQGTEDATARRLVDFASGLVFGLGGRIETVANRVYMLTPANVEVSAEERQRLQEGGFYNQF